MDLQIGDVVMRAGAKAGTVSAADIGDIVDIAGERCRVSWRDQLVPNFWRPEEKIVRKGKRTWVNRKALTKKGSQS